MKILIKGAKGGGWSEYTIEGTKRKPRDKDLIEILDGNPKLGDLITNQSNWKENEYQIVLAFKGKPPRQVIRKALKMFKKHFMAGFEEDEYHFDAIAHFDSDDSHVHIRIPKENQRTGTQLQLYWHKKDMDRVNLIRDYINYELDLDVSVNEKPLIKESAEIERIQKWREQSGQDPFEFDTKKNREKAKLMIAHVIKAEHEDGNIESLEDLRTFFDERYPQHSIVKEGYDKPKDFHYFTIQNKEGDKLRLDGEFYSEAFWAKTRELRLDQFDNNKQEPKSIEKKTNVAAELELATQKRIEEIEKKYKKARARVSQERGRELARQKKFNEKKEAEERKYDLNRRSDQAVRGRVSTGEEREGAREGRVHLAVAELVSNSFTVDTGRSEEASSIGTIEAVARDENGSLEAHRRRAVGYYSESKELDTEVAEAIESEQRIEEFGNKIADFYGRFKETLNEWGGEFIEENRRKIESYGRKIRERVDEFKDGIRGLEADIERWVENAPVRKAHARIKEMKEENALTKPQLKSAKPRPG